MTVNSELDSAGSCQVCGYFSVRAGRKYILALVVIKLVIIWYIYTQSTDMWPLAPSPTVSVVKKNNITLFNVTLFHIPLTHRKDMVPYYVEVSTNVFCFLNGINLKTSKSKKICQCLPQWHGLDCGIPEAVWKSSYLQEGRQQGVEIRRRVMPRRIISVLLFINEFDLLEIIVRETFQVIDVFLVVEENITSPSPLFSKLKAGFLSEFQDKIMPISVKKIKGEVADFMQWSLLMLKNLWTEVWEHISDFRPDDIFLFSHVSSILTKDVLMFLKLYDGYPEPFFFYLRPVAYQFRREIIGNHSVDQKWVFPPLGCSFQYLHFICDSNFNNLFDDICLTDVKLKEKYEKNYWKLKKWLIGSPNFPSGWQCNWCSKVHDINSTLKTHRWLLKTFNLSSDFLNSNKSQNLKNMIDEGKWFDGSNISSKLLSNSNPFFAPEIVKSEQLKYSFLIGD